MIPDLEKQETIDVAASYDEAYAKLQALRATYLAAFKTTLFEAMKQAGLGHARVEFDGSGDSGSITDVFSASDEGPILNEVPDVTISFTTFGYDIVPVTASENDDVDKQKHAFRIVATTKPAALTDVLEEIFWDLIGRRHSGWENGEGAYGECRFDATNGTITLEVNERYTEYHYHEYEF